MGLTLQAARSRALPPPSSPVSLARGLCVFQNIRAGTHIRHFPLIQSFCFTNGETKAQRSWFIHPNLHSSLETNKDKAFWLPTRVLSTSPLTPCALVAWGPCCLVQMVGCAAKY